MKATSLKYLKKKKKKTFEHKFDHSDLLIQQLIPLTTYITAVVFFLLDSRLISRAIIHNTFLQTPALQHLFCKHRSKLNLLCWFINNFGTYLLRTAHLLFLRCTNAITSAIHTFQNICLYTIHVNSASKHRRKQTLFTIQGHALH